ncbi:MAG: HNH endonuclease [Phycisphaerales bacterium]
MVLRRDPICVVCDREPSSEVDHIRPKAQGGEDTEENLQGICKRCHADKTSHESAEARR